VTKTAEHHTARAHGSGCEQTGIQARVPTLPHHPMRWSRRARLQVPRNRSRGRRMLARASRVWVAACVQVLLCVGVSLVWSSSNSLREGGERHGWGVETMTVRFDAFFEDLSFFLVKALKLNTNQFNQTFRFLRFKILRLCAFTDGFKPDIYFLRTNKLSRKDL